MHSRSTTILGLNDSNSAAAIIRDGVLIAMAREERFDRIKFSDSYPTHAVNYCLKEAGVTLKQVDQVVFAWNPGHELEPQDSSAAVRYHKHFLHYIPNNLLRHIGGDKSNKRISGISQKIDFTEGELNIHFLPHHHCHAASAFFVSPFESAAILTIDAYGDDITTMFLKGAGNHIDVLGHTLYPHSLGQVYAGLTQYLGFRANADEWKVMGMAAFGEPEFYDLFANMITFDRKAGELRVNLDYFMFYVWHPRRYSDLFISQLGPERQPDEPLTQRHINLAASFQLRVEDVVLQMCNYLYEKAGKKTLCLSGGVTMNSRMNGRIFRETPFEHIWIQPSADDAGGSLGACFYYWNQVLANPRTFTMDHDYWGEEYDNDSIEAVLIDAKVSYERLENIAVHAANALAENKIIAWFQGRMEAGQRALGNRSILADPRDPDVKERINRLIKHREWFRPFAPSVIEECQTDFFDLDTPSPFMQMVVGVSENQKKIIPGVVHADGTARIQTVSRSTNAKYWELINEFRKLTGVGVVLNTSFNDNDEPIVRTPKQAIRTFYSTGLDQLYLGNFRLRKDI